MLDPIIAGAAEGVVVAMTTPMWDSVKSKVSKLLGRGDSGRQQALERRLEDSRQQLVQSGTSIVTAQWQARFEDLADEDPAIMPLLRALLEELKNSGVTVGAEIFQQIDVRDQGTAFTVGKGTQYVTRDGGKAAPVDDG